MKRYFLSLIIAAIVIGGCKKDLPKEEPPIPEPPVTSISISGDTYPVVKIGTRYWTAVNYAGHGGETNPVISDMLNAGKFYSLTEAKAVSLPKGWRLPTREDYVQLIVNAGGTAGNGGFEYTKAVGDAIKDKNSWLLSPGDERSGFNAVAAGVREAPNSFGLWGTGAFFFTSSMQAIGIPAKEVPVYFAITESEDFITHEDVIIIRVNGIDAPDNKASVRFVRDVK